MRETEIPEHDKIFLKTRKQKDFAVVKTSSLQLAWRPHTEGQRQVGGLGLKY